MYTYFLLVIAFAHSFAFCSFVPGTTSSGSGSAGSAASTALTVLKKSAVPLDPTNEQKAKIGAINAQLQALPIDDDWAKRRKPDGTGPERTRWKSPEELSDAHSNWSKRKKIIEKAVREGIHPDHLRAYEDNPLNTVVIYEQNDIGFARFLLQNGADPNQEHAWKPFYRVTLLFACIEKPEMAELFFAHGGERTIKTHGIALLSSTIQEDRVLLPMLKWYIAHEVDVNTSHESLFPLQTITFRCGLGCHVIVPKRRLMGIKVLVEAGALLSLRFQIQAPYHVSGLNAPQRIKESLEYYNNEQSKHAEISSNGWGYSNLDVNTALRRIAKCWEAQKRFFSKARAFLMEESRNRHGIAQLLREVLIDKNVSKELVPLVQEYYMPLEPSYEELEAMPVEHTTACASRS